MYCLRCRAKLNIIAILMIGIIVLSMLIMGNTVQAADRESGFSKIEDQIYATLVSEGYSHAGACGVLGNIYAENPDYIADLEANNGSTYGLFQWTDTGQRRRRMIIWCNNHLLQSDTVTGQMAFAIHEIEGGDSIASRLSDYLKATENAGEAAEEFAVGFERCIGSTNNPSDDGIYSGNLYPEHSGETYQALSKRVEAARRYDEGFSNYKLRKRDILPIREALDRGIVDEVEDNIEITILKSFEIKPQYSPVKLWLYRLLCILIGYLFGCILIEDVIARQVRHASIFEMGDKVPHFGNVYNSLGKKEAAVGILLDLIKMGLAFLIAYLITKGALLQSTMLWTGIGAVLGHDFPVWNKFRGGYGVVLTGIVFIAYIPLWGSISCMLGIISAIVLKSFPVGALVCSLFMVPFVFAERGWKNGLTVIAFAILIVARQYKVIIKFFRKYAEIIQRSRVGGKENNAADRVKGTIKDIHKDSDTKNSTKDMTLDIRELRKLTHSDKDFEEVDLDDDDYEYIYVSNEDRDFDTENGTDANAELIAQTEYSAGDDIEDSEEYPVREQTDRLTEHQTEVRAEYLTIAEDEESTELRAKRHTDESAEYHTYKQTDGLPEKQADVRKEQKEVPVQEGKIESGYIDDSNYSDGEDGETDRKFTTGLGFSDEVEFSDAELDSYESELEYYGEEIFAYGGADNLAVSSDENGSGSYDNGGYTDGYDYEGGNSVSGGAGYDASYSNAYISEGNVNSNLQAEQNDEGILWNGNTASEEYEYTEEFEYEGQNIFYDYLPQSYGMTEGVTSLPEEEYVSPVYGIEVNQSQPAGYFGTDLSAMEYGAAAVVNPVMEYAAEPVMEYPVEAKTEPAMEYIAEEVVNPVMEYVSEPVREYPAEAKTEPATEYIAEEVANPIMEYAAEPVREYQAKAKTGHAIEYIAEEVKEPRYGIYPQFIEDMIPDPLYSTDSRSALETGPVSDSDLAAGNTEKPVERLFIEETEVPKPISESCSESVELPKTIIKLDSKSVSESTGEGKVSPEAYTKEETVESVVAGMSETADLPLDELSEVSQKAEDVLKADTTAETEDIMEKTEGVTKATVSGHGITFVQPIHQPRHNSYGVKDNPFEGYYSKEAERKKEPKINTSVTQLSRSNYSYDRKEKTFAVRPDADYERTTCVRDKEGSAKKLYGTDSVVVNKVSRGRKSE